MRWREAQRPVLMRPVPAPISARTTRHLNDFAISAASWLNATEPAPIVSREALYHLDASPRDVALYCAAWLIMAAIIVTTSFGELLSGIASASHLVPP